MDRPAGRDWHTVATVRGPATDERATLATTRLPGANPMPHHDRDRTSIGGGATAAPCVAALAALALACFWIALGLTRRRLLS